MGQLYDMCQEAMHYIDRSGLDPFKTRGAITLEVGFLISLVDPSEPDDPGKIAAVRAAVKKVLNIDL